MTANGAFDLQSHSIYSDGALAPREVVSLAAEAGVRVLALTDHDTVEGVDEAVDASAGLDVRIVPATELSSVHGERQDLHVLGYGIDHHDPALLKSLERFRADREARAWKMADTLEGLGYALDRSVLQRRADAGKPIGRPHLSQAVVNHPANAERLKSEGLDDVTPFLVEYLIEGKRAFANRTTPTVREAIELIHASGGVAVWAHPYWDVKEPEEVAELLRLFRSWGLDGVEAFYTTHTEEQTRHVVGLADELDLLTTGSADFHGPSHRIFKTFRDFETYDLTPRLGPVAG